MLAFDCVQGYDQEEYAVKRRDGVAYCDLVSNMAFSDFTLCSSRWLSLSWAFIVSICVWSTFTVASFCWRRDVRFPCSWRWKSGNKQ